MPHDHGESARCYSAKARGQRLAIRAKKGRAYSKGESNTKGSVRSKKGELSAQEEKAVIYTHTYL